MQLTLPLLIQSAEQVVAWRAGRAITAATFLRDVKALAARLPEHAYAINLCDDRYLFLLSFAAVIVKGQSNLLPPNHASQTISDVVAMYPDSYCLSESVLPTLTISSLSQVNVAALSETPANTAMASDIKSAYEVPQIPATQLAAVAFTSGSTGKPSANLKSWEQLVIGTQRIQEGFKSAFDSSFTIVATVPPQHMYGLENSILLPLISGAAIYAGRPLFPQDIGEALDSVPAPRMLVTTPVHLKSCVGSGVELPELGLVVSATAPLDSALAANAEATFKTQVLEIYGCTESGSLAMRRTLDGDEWQLLRGFDITCASSPSNDTDEEQTCMVSASHLTEQVRLHDEIELLTQHRFRLQGRKADMINIAGKRASLADLNIKLNQIEGVKDGVIICPDDDTDNVQRLVAIVAAPGLSQQQILMELKIRLDPAFLPRPIYKVDQLPREATGKLPKSRLVLLLHELRNKSKGTPA